MVGFVTNSVPVNVIGRVWPSTVTLSATETGKFPVSKPESPTVKVPVCSVNEVPTDGVVEFALSESESAEGLNVFVAVAVIDTVSAEAGRVASPKLARRESMANAFDLLIERIIFCCSS